jgi:hypothetical protein
MYVIPSVERVQTEAGKGTLSVRLDSTDAGRLGDIVNTALGRAGAPPLSPETIAALAKTVRVEHPELTIPLTVDIGQYRRGLAKIIYELACLWLGERYPEDPQAKMIREFIFDDNLPLDPSTKYSLHGTMRMAPKDPLLPFWPAERDHLMAFMIRYPDSVGIAASVLGVLDASVIVTNDPRAYEHSPQRFVSIDPRTGIRRQSTFEEEVTRICGDDS